MYGFISFSVSIIISFEVINIVFFFLMNKAACTDAEESSLIQIENRLDDMMVTTEDWLYYLQDLMDLKIPKITENLIYYGLNKLNYP